METIITPNDILISPEGDQMIMAVKCPLDPVGRPSSTGRSLVVATTQGFIRVGDHQVSINVIKKRS